MAERVRCDSLKQQKRIRLVLFFLVSFFFVIIGRMFFVQVIRHDYYLKIASTQHWSRDNIPAKRGKIFVKDNLSSNGLFPLADNQTLYLVSVSSAEMYKLKKDETKIDKKEEVAEKLSPLLEIDKEKLLEQFEKTKNFVPLKHHLSYETAKKIEELNLWGVYISEQQKRYYPEGTLASQIIGYVDSEGKGNYGVEQLFDDVLAGVPGILKSEVDPTRRRIAFGRKISTPAKDGGDIVLTINRDVQAEAEKIISETVKKFSATNGSLIVMDPSNGEIVAMANYPTFDPNEYSKVKDYGLFRNSAVTDEFEPGSTFKVITMAMGLDDGKIEPDTQYTDTGSILLGGFKIMNSTRKAWGLVDMTFVLEESLNTGTVFVLNKVGQDKFYNYLKKFGFAKKTGIEQLSEGVGRIYAPGEVNEHGYATMSFGQGMTATPIQMISSFATIANNGISVKPHLIAEIIKSGKKQATDNREGERVISNEAAAKLTKMMVSQVEKGHGKQAGVKGYKVAGKTGTAQVPSKNGGYEKNKNIGSFIGFGPADSPRFVVLAKIDYPKGVAWAESTAAPPVGKMLDFLFKYYQIPPTENGAE